MKTIQQYNENVTEHQSVGGVKLVGGLGKHVTCHYLVS